ncbi:MAG: secretin N-terminal domain-containing protein [Verrucomicrobiota bacterium]
MKTANTFLLMTTLVAGLSTRAAEPPTPVPLPGEPVPTNATTLTVNATNSLGADAPPLTLILTNAVDTNAALPAAIGTNTEVMFYPGTNAADGLRLNFHGVPLEMVLSYLSDAAGFVVVLEADVRGKVDVWSSQPVSKEEAINLLNAVLNKNGYAAIRNERTLTIVSKDEAKARDIPVKSGSDPNDIPRNAEIVTQIIPIRFVEAVQLIKDLTPLVSPQTTMTANEGGNAIVITDTQANIHRVAEIIKAIDGGAEDSTQVRVFKLKYADPVEMADLLGNVFPDDSRSGGSQAPVQFGGGFGGGFRAMFGGMGGGRGGGAPGGAASGGASAQSQRNKKRARVIAVADQRTSSVVVSAARDLIDQVAGMIEQLDANPAKKQKVYVYSLENASVQEVSQILRDMFDRNGTSNSRNNTTQNSPLTTRSTQSQTGSTGTSTTGTGGTSRGVGGGGGVGGGF